MPTLASIFALIFLMVTAMANFAYTMFGDIDMAELGRHISFRTMFSSIQALFYFVTGKVFALSNRPKEQPKDTFYMHPYH